MSMKLHACFLFGSALAAFLGPTLPGAIALEHHQGPIYINAITEVTVAISNTSTHEIVLRDGLVEELYDQADPKHIDLIGPVRRRNASPVSGEHVQTVNTITVSPQIKAGAGQTLRFTRLVDLGSIAAHPGMYVLITSGKDCRNKPDARESTARA